MPPYDQTDLRAVIALARAADEAERLSTRRGGQVVAGRAGAGETEVSTAITVGDVSSSP
jgi:hypothetical protein